MKQASNRVLTFLLVTVVAGTTMAGMGESESPPLPAAETTAAGE